jgi:serine/threonine protein kinase
MSSNPSPPASDAEAPTQPYGAAPGIHDNPTLAAGATLSGKHVPAAPSGLPPELTDHPRYHVLRLLGQGGMGAVYQAEHRVMERLVALKVIRADLTADVAAVDRFRREVRAAAALSHANIVTAFDAEQVGNVHFLVMEYVEGVDLARHVARRGPLPVDEACSHVRQAALGLQHAFERGMIHRDIKPHNLMLTHTDSAKAEPFGRVKILDFGLARLAGASVQNAQTASGMLLGSVDFMAPEQADDARTVDIRADIYSLGSTLYYLLSGRVLFPEMTLLQKVVAVMEKQPPPLSQYRIDLPPSLLTVVGRMLAKNPEHRYQTPAEVAHVLMAFVEGRAASIPDVQHDVPVLEKHVPVAPLLEAAEPAVPSRNVPEPPRRSSATEALPRRRPRWKRYLIGGVLLLSCLFGGSGWLGYKGVTGWIDRLINPKRAAWEDVNRKWKPPPENASVGQLFPQAIGSYKLEGVTELTEIPQLGIKAKGRRAVYKDFWKMELCAFHVKSTAEGEAILQNAEALLHKHDSDVHRDKVATASGDAHCLLYEFHPFHLNNMQSDLPRGAMWYRDGWLFVLQVDSMGPEPETMLLKYLDR